MAPTSGPSRNKGPMTNKIETENTEQDEGVEFSKMICPRDPRYGVLVFRFRQDATADEKDEHCTGDLAMHNIARVVFALCSSFLRQADAHPIANVLAHIWHNSNVETRIPKGRN